VDSGQMMDPEKIMYLGKMMDPGQLMDPRRNMDPGDVFGRHPPGVHLDYHNGREAVASKCYGKKCPARCFLSQYVGHLSGCRKIPHQN
jgi:hypothetical protein